MAINKYNIKKWFKMIIGKSTLHTKQGIGKIYSKEEIKGYYSDLTAKVNNEKYVKNNIPLFLNQNNELEEFSIMIFQYGLGAYDLYLQKINVKDNFEKFRATLNWAVEKQLDNGAWVTFKQQENGKVYSSMAQGEGISLLLRGYIEFKEDKYFELAKKALQYMMKSVEENGTTEYKGNDVYLKECIQQGELVILNGWIFSLWGIYDYLKIDKDNKEIKEFYQRTILTLEKELCKFDNGYWSMYDMGEKIASPFYHNLHIQQLKVMYDITNRDIFKDYANRFEIYERKFLNRKRAFIVKASQKILEK